ncbi:hypothetical protein [Alkalilimnicola ehrlichii]|nr:hypothetical protein [Alkalilimnicola ehrlichii]
MKRVRQAHLDLLRGLLERVDREARYSTCMIDMLLMNAGKPRLKPSELER